MKSNVCKIEKGTADLGAILAESEKVAAYIGLDHKQAMKLRLICEEIDGLLPNITDEFEGDFWIEHEDGACKVNVSITVPEFNAAKKKELIALAKDNKNAAAAGIVGKIRNAIENFFLSEGSTNALDTSSITFHTATGYSEGVDYSYLWTLQQYKDTIDHIRSIDDKNERNRHTPQPRSIRPHIHISPINERRLQTHILLHSRSPESPQETPLRPARSPHRKTTQHIPRPSGYLHYTRRTHHSPPALNVRTHLQRLDQNPTIPQTRLRNLRKTL